MSSGGGVYLFRFARAVSAGLYLASSVVLIAIFGIACLCGLVPYASAQTPTPVPVLTWRYDLTHSGANTQETALTPANVASSAFGKLFSLRVDDRVFAQPLYVPSLKMSDGQVHNVLFIATENDSIYAFDADVKGNPIWHVSLLDAAHGATSGATPVPQADVAPSEDIGPNIGITGTPAINPATNTLYVVSNTKENGQYFSRLHAINIITGADQAGSPVAIKATVAGTGDGSSGGQVSFDPLWTNQRAALDYYNGYVYIAYSSHGDVSPFHGWVFAYNASTMQQTGAICLSPNDSGASVWGSGAGLPIDTNTDKLFIVTSNGDRNTPFKSTSDYGESVVAFNIANGQLAPVDEWTTYNYKALNTPDNDLGSGGLLMLPDQQGAYAHEILAAGKEGRVSILNRDNLGGLSSGSNSNAIQDFLINGIDVGQGFWSTAAYWNGNVYDWAGGDDGGTPNVGMAFKLNNGTLTTTPSSKTTMTSAFPGVTFSVSSNGTQDGIVWGVRADQFNSWGPAVLYAFDADDLSNVLYESDKNSNDTAGPANKFSVPVVTNGKVYIATNGEIDVYGLLDSPEAAAAPTISPNGGTFTTAQSVTMTSTTPSAQIFYTLDGSTPTTGSTQYSGPITVSTDTTVKAIATAAGYSQSNVSTATFTFSGQAPPVSCAPGGGTYASPQTVTLSDTDASATIYYTTDGSTPSASSTAYTSPIQVGVSETIKAVAIDPALANSNVTTAAYVIQASSNSIDFSNGFASTAGLTLNGSTAGGSNSALELTNGGANQTGSFFWSAPINVQAFTTTFKFQMNNAQANGFTFTIQNMGPTALGGGSAGLGYQDIQKSVAVKFNFYNYNGEGGDSTGLYTNGQAPTTPTVDISPSGIQLASGDSMQAQLVYDGTTLTLNLKDLVTNATFTNSWPINITQTVGGNTAYVGFTGGTGGLTANEDILSWTYNTQAVPPAFTPAAGTYSAAQSVTLASATSDAKIYYTTDGSDPSASGNSNAMQYSGAISVASSETIKALAMSPTMGNSGVVSAAYVISPGTNNATFSMSGTNASVSAPGASGTSTITITPSGGFTGTVKLACSVSGGPTCTVSQPPAISGSQAVQATLTINTAESTAAGNYTATVTGTSGSVSQTATVAVVVNPPAQTPSFAVSGTAVNISAPGASGTSTITITPSGGFTGNVALACAVAAPAGTSGNPTCTVAQPPAISGTGAVTGTLTVATQSTTSAGNYTVNVTGTSGSVTQSATVAVVVSPPPQTPSFSLSGTAISMASGATSGTSTITITPSGGFTGAVSLACALTSSPANAQQLPTCSVNQPSAISGTQAVTATLTVNATASMAASRNPFSALGGGALAMLFFFWLPRRRRTWQALLGLVAFAAIVTGSTGCGITRNVNAAPVGTTAGAYVITVTGTSGTLQATTTVNVKVQ